MKLIAMYLVLIASLQSDAQKYPTLKGTYVINKDKVQWGRAPQRVLPAQYSIEPQKGRIAVKRKMLDQDKEILENMNFDGSSFDRETSSGKASAWFNSIDDTSFMVNKLWVDKEGTMRMKAKETWAIEDGGKMLTIKFDVAQADGNNYTLIGYYEKK